MQCILYKIYFLKVFHMYYNLICIFICTPICTKFYSCEKWVLQNSPVELGRTLSRKVNLDAFLFKATKGS
jgi:hypothetical protein